MTQTHILSRIKEPRKGLKTNRHFNFLSYQFQKKKEQNKMPSVIEETIPPVNKLHKISLYSELENEREKSLILLKVTE